MNKKTKKLKLLYTETHINTRNSAIADKPRDAFKYINLRKIP